MRADYRAVLDACVLIPMPLADSLLRMAEAPRLYLPKWSQTIMDEVTGNPIAKWGLAPEKARRRELELRRHFPEAWVEGFDAFIAAMTNDPGDRHVLAAAVRSHSGLIVTYNRRHFPPAPCRHGRSRYGGRQRFRAVSRLRKSPCRCRVFCTASPRTFRNSWITSARCRGSILSVSGKGSRYDEEEDQGDLPTQGQPAGYRAAESSN